jgi:hypothetical protein
MHHRENTSNGINNQDIGSLIGFTDAGAMHKTGDPPHLPTIDHIPRFPVFPGKEGMYMKNNPNKPGPIRKKTGEQDNGNRKAGNQQHHESYRTGNNGY